MTNENTENKVNPRDAFLTTTEEEKKNEEYTPIPELDLKRPKRIEKKLKGLHIETDVLEVFERLQESRERGWGSQIVSDWMREKFEDLGLFEKYGVKNQKKED